MNTKRVLQGAKIAKICDSCYQVLLIVKLTVGVKIVPSTVGDAAVAPKLKNSKKDGGKQKCVFRVCES